MNRITNGLSYFRIGFQEARKLKKLGFSETTTSFWEIKTDNSEARSQSILKLDQGEKDWNNEQWFIYSAPTRAEVFEWLRRKHNYYIYIIPRFDGLDGSQYFCHYSIFREGDKESCDINGDGSYTYSEAEIEAINEVIKILGG